MPNYLIFGHKGGLFSNLITKTTMKKIQSCEKPFVFLFLCFLFSVFKNVLLFLFFKKRSAIDKLFNDQKYSLKE